MPTFFPRRSIPTEPSPAFCNCSTTPASTRPSASRHSRISSKRQDSRRLSPTTGWREIWGQPRLLGFGTVDLTRSDIEAQVRHAKSLGLYGLKLHPNSQKFDLLSPPALKAYAAAEAQELFISFHSGVHRYPLKGVNVLHFDEIAEKFPDLRFSLEHVGGYSFFPDALAVIVNHIPYPPVPGRRCMVYAGLTSCLTPNFLRFWYLPPERLNELILQAGVDQLIFGLDFPYNLETHIETAINTIRGLDLLEPDQAKILGGNLREAIGLPAV